MEIVTIIDKIYEDIKRKKKMKFSEIKENYKIDPFLLESLLKELEKDGLVKIIYPTSPFSDIVVYEAEAWEHERSIRRERT